MVMEVLDARVAIVAPAGIPVPLIGIPTAIWERAAVGIAVIELVPKTSATPVPAALVGMEMVIAVPETIEVTVAPAGIPVPLTGIPVARVAVLGIAVIEVVVPSVVPVVENELVVPVVEKVEKLVKISAVATREVVAEALKVMDVELRIDATVVPGGMPEPVTEAPMLIPTVLGMPVMVVVALVVPVVLIVETPVAATPLGTAARDATGISKGGLTLISVMFPLLWLA